MCRHSLIPKSVKHSFALVHTTVQYTESSKKRNERSDFLWWHQSRSFWNFSNNGHARDLVKNISRLILNVHIMNFDSLSGNFLLNPEMGSLNVLSSCDGFDRAGNLSCAWVITENWSILQVEDSFVDFVGKVDNFLQEFYFGDSLKQSIELSFYGTSWDVTLCSWFRIDQRIRKKCRLEICFFLFLHRKWNHCQKFPASFSIVSYSLAFLARSSEIWRYFDKNNCSSTGIVQLASCINPPMSWRNKWRSNFSSSYSRNLLGVEWGSIEL